LTASCFHWIASDVRDELGILRMEKGRRNRYMSDVAKADGAANGRLKLIQIPPSRLTCDLDGRENPNQNAGITV
jgi:hypothetical protein